MYYLHKYPYLHSGSIMFFKLHPFINMHARSSPWQLFPLPLHHQQGCGAECHIVVNRAMYEKYFLLCYRSMAICQLVYRYPILLDAATAAVMRKGDRFLARWADIMTGRVPKIHLLRPEFVVVITFELAWLLIQRLLGYHSVTKQPKKKA